MKGRGDECRRGRTSKSPVCGTSVESEEKGNVRDKSDSCVKQSRREFHAGLN